MNKPDLKLPGIGGQIIKLVFTYACYLGGLYLAVRVVILAIKHSIGA